MNLESANIKLLSCSFCCCTISYAKDRTQSSLHRIIKYIHILLVCVCVCLYVCLSVFGCMKRTSAASKNYFVVSLRIVRQHQNFATFGPVRECKNLWFVNVLSETVRATERRQKGQTEHVQTCVYLWM